MRRSASIEALVLALTLAACNKAGNPTQAHSGVAKAVDTDAVVNLEERFIAGWEAKNPSVKSLYAPDAVMVVPSAGALRDPGSISQAFDRYASNPDAALDFDNAATVISAGGDLAFSQGTYTSRTTDPATKSIDEKKGYYVLIYRKQPDGSWKVIQDVSSPIPDNVRPRAAL